MLSRKESARSAVRIQEWWEKGGAAHQMFERKPWKHETIETMRMNAEETLRTTTVSAVSYRVYVPSAGRWFHLGRWGR